MADLSQVREHMKIVGADGVNIGTVDHVEGDRIKMTKADSGSHGGHHHYISGGLVAAVGDEVRLSANADAAVLLEEEKGGEGIFDSAVDWKKVGVGAAAVAGVAAAAAGAVMMKRRGDKGSDKD